MINSLLNSCDLVKQLGRSILVEKRFQCPDVANRQKSLGFFGAGRRDTIFNMISFYSMNKNFLVKRSAFNLARA